MFPKNLGYQLNFMRNIVCDPESDETFLIAMVTLVGTSF